MAEASWQYVAENRQGEIVRGTLTAETKERALSQLQAEAMSPVSLKPGAAKLSESRSLFSNARRLELKDFALIARGLADLVNAGIPVADALSLLAKRQKRTRLRRFLDDQSRRLRAGTSLAASLEQDRMQVPRLMSALVAAGEASGELGPQLSIVAEALEREQKLRRELLAQIIYPCALLVLIVLTIVFLSYFVLPQFETIFANADALPPPETRFVIAGGAMIREYGSALPLVFLVLLLGGGIVRQRYEQTLSVVLLSLPGIGGFIRKRDAGNYCRSLGALVRGGTSLSAALPIATRAVASSASRQKYEDVAEGVRTGGQLSIAFEREQIVPEDIIGLIEIGEASGTLGEMLLKAADLCDNDIRAFLTRLTSLSGPVLTAVMGLITAAVIASVMSGVLGLNDAIY